MESWPVLKADIVMLTELQKDVLTEAFNLGMGVAASSLSEMVGEEVQLSVPELIFTPKAEATTFLEAQSSGSLSGVIQSFNGPLNGYAMLLFPAQKSLELVRLLLQHTLPLEKLTELEEEALNEIGNIILNAGLSSLANLFEDEIPTSLPMYIQGMAQDILQVKEIKSGVSDTVMFLRVDFRLERHAVDGNVVFLLDVASIQDLSYYIDNYLSKIKI